MKAKEELKVMLDPRFRKDLDEIRKKMRKSVRPLVQEAVEHYVNRFREDEENRRFIRIASAKARKIGIRTDRDVERLIDSIRD